ncbi:hypothetical protein E1292_30410 [Nonomuraea deserti]|uniref:Uncharacterized protein n=1 Tax=Nonomuraea deserti TaxID=1848322 RepID=A0A4R4VBL6_9ACTN|nr:hypothetical protein [Nonomuraea deserti]TDC99872.1 hypothetical protein E1292_30410 [Nonomuraea deserti]
MSFPHLRLLMLGSTPLQLLPELAANPVAPLTAPGLAVLLDIAQRPGADHDLIDVGGEELIELGAARVLSVRLKPFDRAGDPTGGPSGSWSPRNPWRSGRSSSAVDSAVPTSVIRIETINDRCTTPPLKIVLYAEKLHSLGISPAVVVASGLANEFRITYAKG